MSEPIKIAVMLGNLRMDLYDGMKLVADWGVPGLHISVDGGIWDARTLDAAGRKELVKHVAGLGLEISAISCWGGQVDLGEAEKWDENIAWGKQVMELAADLECGIWQGHCGIMPEHTSDPKWARFLEGMQILSQHGEKVGAKLAIETGPEPAFVLRRLLDAVGSPNLCLNWDPANMFLWPAKFARDLGEPYNKLKWIEKFQPNEGALALGDKIIHTHAKDALVLDDGTGKEVPLGEGWVDWPRYVGYLRECGYDGYFAIEREVGANPAEDIKKAVDFLRTL
ncbi:MAG: sugar phosphate isomerase/epimerase [Armatimonadetes bacterium]|nr:sugar phosphate isomerase/epimerase [Armatimonadota bacterium]